MRKLIFALFTVLTLASCNKEDIQPNDNPVATTSEPVYVQFVIEYDIVTTLQYSTTGDIVYISTNSRTVSLDKGEYFTVYIEGGNVNGAQKGLLIFVDGEYLEQKVGTSISYTYTAN